MIKADQNWSNIYNPTSINKSLVIPFCPMLPKPIDEVKLAANESMKPKSGRTTEQDSASVLNNYMH
jgi:hypothetical protein